MRDEKIAPMLTSEQMHNVKLQIDQAVAGAYEAAAQAVDTTEGEKVDKMVRQQIRDLTPADAARAVEARVAEARLDEAKWWRRDIDLTWLHEDECNCIWCRRIAKLTAERDARKEGER